MRLPSVKTLMSIGITRDTAKAIRAILERESVPRYALMLCSELLTAAYGVEHIAKGHNAKSPAIAYCNMGDTYTTTLMLVRGNFRVRCWGDIVERGNYD